MVHEKHNRLIPCDKTITHAFAADNDMTLSRREERSRILTRWSLERFTRLISTAGKRFKEWLRFWHDDHGMPHTIKIHASRTPQRMFTILTRRSRECRTSVIHRRKTLERTSRFWNDDHWNSTSNWYHRKMQKNNPVSTGQRRGEKETGKDHLKVLHLFSYRL